MAPINPTEISDKSKSNEIEIQYSQRIFREKCRRLNKKIPIVNFKFFSRKIMPSVVDCKNKCILNNMARLGFAIFFNTLDAKKTKNGLVIKTMEIKDNQE